MTQTQLAARASIAADLFREGKIQRCECFRLEMDGVLGRDSGPIQYQENSDFRDGLM